MTLGSSTIVGDKLNVKLQKDGQGGVFVVWQDFRNLLDHDIFAQHFNALGSRLWSEYGVAVCSATGTQNNPKIDPDSVHNGVYIAWADDRGGLGYDIYAQSLNFDGIPQWSLNGLPVCVATGNQSAVDIVSTTSIAGLVLTWKDGRNGLTDIYAQKWILMAMLYGVPMEFRFRFRPMHKSILTFVQMVTEVSLSLGKIPPSMIGM